MSKNTPSVGMLVGLVGLTLAGLVSLSLASFPQKDDLPAYKHLGADFELESTQEYNSLKGAQGKVVLLSFGFTSCHDICPMMVNKFQKVYEKLDKNNQSDQVVMYFVSVDPARDSLETLRRYLDGFDSRIVGLRGPKPQIKALQKSLAVASKAIAGTDQFSHSDRLFLFDSNGTLRAMPSLTDPVDAVVTLIDGLL